MKIAISIAGGGIKALLAVGVYRALKDNGVNVEIISGMSAGSMVASILALDLDRTEEDRILQSVKLSKIINFNPFSGLEILSHKRLSNFLRTIFKGKSFESLDKKLILFASNLETKETEVLDSGDLISAIIASASLAPFLNPTKREGKILVDGGVSTFYGTKYLKEIGADFIIGIDPGAFESPSIYGPFKKFTDTALVLYKRATILENKYFPVDLELTDFPTKVPPVSLKLFNKELIDVGYQATLKNLPLILP